MSRAPERLLAWTTAYCLSNSAGPSQEPICAVPEYEIGLPLELFPDLDFNAPEYCSLEIVSPAADMFSYGMLVFILYNRKPLLQSNGN